MPLCLLHLSSATWTCLLHGNKQTFALAYSCVHWQDLSHTYIHSGHAAAAHVCAIRTVLNAENQYQTAGGNQEGASG